MSGLQYDVTIIGGGVTGAAVARELSRYQLKTCVVERAEDVCSGTSKANSAIVHAGYDAAAGSLKAKMNVEGNEMMGRDDGAAVQRSGFRVPQKRFPGAVLFGRRQAGVGGPL